MSLRPSIAHFLMAPSAQANILIDRTGHACIADFGLLTIASSATNITSSNSFLIGGTIRWMSPELFDPEEFNLKDSRPTKCSDRYAFGMVMYEVLSGQLPFSKYHDFVVVAKVLKGKRPARPQGTKGRWFTDGIWSILECCWMPSPGGRPMVKDVLDRLEEVSSSWAPYYPSTAILPTSTTESSSEESPDEWEVSSASYMTSPQLSQRLRLEGNPYDPAPSNDTANHRALGTAVTNLGVSKESERIVDRVSLVPMSLRWHPVLNLWPVRPYLVAATVGRPSSDDGALVTVGRLGLSVTARCVKLKLVVPRV